tara:strand:+ start:55 stop:1428 length:1374 start_codon:yes stop_codon:yes gene_type:complete
MLFNYLGPQGVFPYYSIADILNGRNDLAKKNYFKDKVVLVGATAKGLKDIRKTPFDPVMPGVEIHATIIDNILQQRFIYQPDWTSLADGVCLVFLGIFFTFVYRRVRPIYSPVIWLAVVVLLFAANHLIFTQKHFWISNVFPQMEHLLIFGSLMIYRYVVEEKHKRYIKNVFGRYVAPSVIDRLLENPDKLKLGGEEKELTAFFTDIAGFLNTTEKLSPMEFVSLLNEYLSEMTHILFKYYGTLDKYDGDAIKAFFGAPIYFPDHAKRACWVAIEMQERLNELRIHWKQKGKPEFFTRIGINTGPMVVGNFGSKRRMNYGMNGDAVNLAARLEGANKAYGTFSMISQTTYEQAKEFIEARELDCIKVVGREDPVTVYELLGKKDFRGNSIQEILPHYNQGLQHYKDQCWDKAIESFRKAIDLAPEDGPSLTYLNRCEHFKKSPPDDKWDGIFSLSNK